MEQTQSDAESFAKFLEYKAKGLDAAAWYVRKAPGGQAEWPKDDWTDFLLRPVGGNEPDRWYTFAEFMEIRRVLGDDHTQRAVLYLPEQRPET